MNMRFDATQTVAQETTTPPGNGVGQKFTLVATAKNEGPYVLEWVAHHRAIGFTDILVYQNDSDDMTHRTLRNLHQLGLIKYFRNDNPRRNYQIRAYRRAGNEPEFRNADWAMALDLDEFLVIKTGDGTLSSYLKALPDSDEVLINWRLFGSGGHALPSSDLVTERFVMAEPSDAIATYVSAYKSLFKPEKYERPGIHKPRRLDEFADAPRNFVNGSGLKPDAFDTRGYRTSDPEMRALAQINHYAVRDAGSFLLKTCRGRAHQDQNPVNRRYWRNRDINAELDTSALDGVARTKALMDEYIEMSNRALYNQRCRSLEMHLTGIEKLLENPATRAHYLYFLGRRPGEVAE